jgi:hypothetical protein
MEIREVILEVPRHGKVIFLCMRLTHRRGKASHDFSVTEEAI